MIELNHISKSYGNILALDDLSLKIEAGRAMGLLGKNGAGKSTLMNILVGCLRQDEGTVCINGYDMSRNPLETKKAFGYLPENVPVYPELTTQEYLRYAARLNLVPASERTSVVEEAISQLDLGKLRHRLIGSMSKGQRQRVGLAQAMYCTKASILILDEPTSGLDPSQIAQFREILRSFRGQKTVLLSSHILSDVTQVCDEIAIIDNGRLVAQGDKDELIARYASYAHLELGVASNFDAILARLCAHPRILEVQAKAGCAEGCGMLSIRSDGDIRADVFGMAVECNAILTNLSAPESTLDYIFARVTSANQEGA